MHGSSMARWARLGCALVLALPVSGFAESSVSSETVEDQRLRTEFYSALSQQLRGQPEPRMQLAAAILAGNLFPRGNNRDAQEQYPAEAQALFTTVRQGSSDPLVLRFAATHCRFDAVACDADGAIAQLLDVQPLNAENLVLALHRANGRGDSGEVDRLLGLLAKADHFEGGYPEAWRWWWDVYRLAADDPRLFAIAGLTAEQARSMTPSMLVGSLAFGHALALPILGREVIAGECAVTAERFVDHTRRLQCRTIAQLLRDKGGSLLDQRTGFPILWGLAADEAERTLLESEWRQNQWTMIGGPVLAADEQTYSASDLQLFEHLIASLQRGSTEIEAFAASRRAAGLRLDPPENYQPTRTLAQIDEARRLAAAAERSRVPATSVVPSGELP